MWQNPDEKAEEVFITGTLVSTDPAKEVSKVKLKDGKELEVRSTDVSAANPDGVTAPDNTMLIHLSEATLLENVRLRFKNKEIYTLTGTILLAMNPFEKLPIYSETIMGPYKGKAPGREPPHVYATAELAYQMLTRNKMPQSIVVSGESGAGKTETNKHLMYYLAWRSKSGGGMETLAEAILQSNPVLEAFGNAKTSRNNNSSRFGKFIKILIDKKGNIVGARMNQYLLEKSRVPTVSEGERNYHSFYHLVAGGGAEAEAAGLGKGTKAFRYLNQSSVSTLEGMPDGEMFEELSSALTTCKVPAPKQKELWGVLAGVLHVGNVTFTGDDNASIADESVSNAACEQLQSAVAACLTQRSMTVGTETTMVPLTVEKAGYARDALGKAVYARLFEWLVAAVNESIKGDAEGDCHFIGLLDVFGFEFFGTNNSFEQLAINFANEKLQQFFLKFVFKSEELEYEREQVRWTPIEYQDNQGCIDLIEKTPNGLLRMLDTQCKTPKASDHSFAVAVNKEHKKHDFFLEPRKAGLRQFKEEDAFVVRHFAGNVCYMSANFLDKNNDTLHPDFELALSKSTNSLLAEMFKPAETKGKGKKSAAFNSVSRRFINDLDSLMLDLNSTYAHFVRCLKPNLQLKPQLMAPNLVLNQLRCSGTFEAVQLISSSYPTRIPYADIHGRYKEHMPDFVQALDPSFFTEAIALACDVSEADYQLGASKIFFRPGKGAFLEELKDRDMTEVVPMLLAKIQEWERKKKARVLIQKFVACWVCKVLYLKKRAQAVRLQSHRRMTKQRREYAVKLAAHKADMARKAEEERKKAAEEKRKKEDDERKRKLEEQQAAEEAKRGAALAAADAVGAAKLEAEAKVEAAMRQAAMEAEEKELKAQRAKEDAEAEKTAKATQDALAKEEKAAASAAAGEAAGGGAAKGGGTPRSAVGTPRSGKKKGAAALLGGGGGGGGDAKPRGPPKIVRKETEFEVTIERDANGLGIEVDSVGGVAVIGAVAPRGAAARQSATMPGDKIIKVFEFETPTYREAIEGIKGSVGMPLEMTLLRSPLTQLMTSDVEMQLGPKREWTRIRLDLMTNREVKFEKQVPPAYNGLVAMREAVEVRVADNPNGGGSMSIMTPNYEYQLRSKDGPCLHRWQRKLNELFPQLGVTVRKEGWLSKRGEGSAANFSKRWCVLDSNYKLHYYKDRASDEEQGNIDLSVAYAASDIKKGMGFEIATPGRTWVFLADDRDVQAGWMVSLAAMLNDLREIKKEQQAKGGKATLKSGEGDYRDDAETDATPPGTAGKWVKRRYWWELLSVGELRVRDGEGAAAKEVATIRLEHVSRVDRTKGNEFYDYCIDIDVEVPGEEERTITLKPPGRSEMQSWLGVLKEQVTVHARQEGEGEGEGGSLSVAQKGWVTLTRRDINHTLGRKWFVLVTEQKLVADEMSQFHTLYWFETQEESVDLACGSALDLSEVEEVGEEDAETLVLSTESGWQLQLEPEAMAEWRRALKATCVNAEGYEVEVARTFTMKPPGAMGGGAGGGGSSLLKEQLKMAVPSGSGVLWRTFECTLTDDEELDFEMLKEQVLDDFAPEDVKGSVDISSAIGTWLVGQPGWRRLDIILTGKKYTFAAEKDETLQKWHKAVSEMTPHKPTMELCKGWLDKKGELGGGWKSRFFVLLSTRELLYFEGENSQKRKGTVDLKEATAVTRIPNEFNNYEEAFEVVTKGRRWIMCPESHGQQTMWMDALTPMVGGEGGGGGGSGGGGGGGGGVPGVYRSRASTTSMMTEQKTVKQGWLHRAGDADSEEGAWERRYAKLTSCWRDGEQEASLDWYIDEGKTPDEDADEMMLPGATAEALSAAEAAEGGRPFALNLSMEYANAVLSTETEAELKEWVAALNSGWREEKAKEKGSNFARLASLRPESKAAKDQGSLLGGGRTSTLAKTRSLMPGAKKAAAAPPLVEEDARASGGSTTATPRKTTGGSGLGRGESNAIIEESEGNEIHSGFMTKRGEGVVAKWAERWFVLYDDGGLTYAESQGGAPKGKIDLGGLKRQDLQRTKVKSSSDYSFSIKTPGRKWMLNPGTEKAFETWEEKIISVMKG